MPMFGHDLLFQVESQHRWGPNTTLFIPMTREFLLRIQWGTSGEQKVERKQPLRSLCQSSCYALRLAATPVDHWVDGRIQTEGLPGLVPSGSYTLIARKGWGSPEQTIWGFPSYVISTSFFYLV